MKLSRNYFHGALASGINYLIIGGNIANYSWKNFRGTLRNHENHESLAQQYITM